MKKLLAFLLALVLACTLCACDIEDNFTVGTTPTEITTAAEVTLAATVTPTVEVTPTVAVTPSQAAPETGNTLSGWEHLGSIPEFSGEPYYVINNNNPFFTDEITNVSYELYGELDSLGRCTVTVACIGVDLMPTEDRGEIGQVKPTGWQTVKYDCVNGKYLYNRCHLIGFQLTGENANVRNLITGTRFMNVDGMLPFENMVADYLKEETENHVMYRVTPVFVADELVARGVLMEAYSVEDNGDGICFNVFCYNAQPQITINYATGESRLSDTTPAPTLTPDPTKAPDDQHYILNTSSKKFHHPSCSSVSKISDSNKEEYFGKREDLILNGYDGCGVCKP